jgi:uncharacterized protein YciI
MSERFAYFYFMRREPERIRSVAPRHTAHWRGLALDDYEGGPFDDRSGGLITFRADDLEQARSAVADDPFVTEGLLAEHWLKRWEPATG